MPPAPGYGWEPPPPPPTRSTGVVVAMAFVGFVIFVVLNVVGFFVTLAAADAVRTVPQLVVGAAAAMLAAIALGGGLLLIRLGKPWAKGLGLGLMIGWGLVSIVTAGFCTGLNPSIYTNGWS